MPFELDELDPLEVPFELELELPDESFELELELPDESFELELELPDESFELELELPDESFELELPDDDVVFDELLELELLFEPVQPKAPNANNAKQIRITAVIIRLLPLLGFRLIDIIGFPLHPVARRGLRRNTMKHSPLRLSRQRTERTTQISLNQLGVKSASWR